MITADWGLDQEPIQWVGGHHPEVVESDDVDAIPDVEAARSRGWEPAPEAPLWAFLPAVWPREQRAWVRDVRARTSTWSCSDGSTGRIPWSTRDHADVEAGYHRLLAGCGLPARPAGRVWLLRPPPTHPGVDAFLGSVLESWVGGGGQIMATPGLVAHVAERTAAAFA